MDNISVELGVVRVSDWCGDADQGSYMVWLAGERWFLCCVVISHLCAPLVNSHSSFDVKMSCFKGCVGVGT